jgi:hypothetical protein
VFLRPVRCDTKKNVRCDTKKNSTRAEKKKDDAKCQEEAMEVG